MRNTTSVQLVSFICFITFFSSCTEEDSLVDEVITEVSTEQNDDPGTNTVNNTKDSDGDGVTDLLDKCPNTPSSENAETSGCALSIQTYVPDDTFEQFLIDSGYDDTMNDYVLTSNIDSLEELDFNGSFITVDLTGLEAFKSLKKLNIRQVTIDSVNISVFKNLERFGLQMVHVSSLDIIGTCVKSLIFEELTVSGPLTISKNHSLSYFSFVNGGMEIFTIESNPVLPILVFESVGGGDDLLIADNDGLKDYSCNTCSFSDVSFIDNANLESFYLDIGAGGSFVSITANNNPKLTSFDDDLSFDTTIISLDLKNNGLSEIDISEASDTLTSFDISGNPLTCVKVKQEQLDNLPVGWIKDAEDNFALNCP